MMEPALSFIAWMSVVLFQAIVQYSVVGGRAKHFDGVQSDSEANALEEQEAKQDTNGVLEFKMDEQMDDRSGESIGSDELNLYFQLLDQTGSEMMKTPSLRNLVEQRITMEQ